MTWASDAGPIRRAHARSEAQERFGYASHASASRVADALPAG